MLLSQADNFAGLQHAINVLTRGMSTLLSIDLSIENYLFARHARSPVGALPQW